MHVYLTQAKGPWMFVWPFNEIIDLLWQGMAFTVLLLIIQIDLLLWQGMAFTVLLIIIQKLIVYVPLITYIRYRSHSHLPVQVSFISLRWNLKLSVIRTLSNPNFSSRPTAFRNRQIILIHFGVKVKSQGRNGTLSTSIIKVYTDVRLEWGTVYREFFASGIFGENDALKVCLIFTESYFRYFKES